MASGAKVALFDREIIQLVNIDMTRCKNVYGDAASGGFCTASGGQCDQGFEITCEDKPNYRDGVTTFQYYSANKKTISIQPSRPYVDTVTSIPIEIDPANFTTKNARLKVTFFEDYADNMPYPPLHSDKRLPSGADRFNSVAAGGYWKNFFHLHPNLVGRQITIKEATRNFRLIS